MNCKEVFIHFVREILYRVARAYFFLVSILMSGSVQVHTDREKVSTRVANKYFFLGSILITVSVHTDREKVSTKPLIILIKALNEGLSSVLL